MSELLDILRETISETGEEVKDFFRMEIPRQMGTKLDEGVSVPKAFLRATTALPLTAWGFGKALVEGAAEISRVAQGDYRGLGIPASEWEAFSEETKERSLGALGRVNLAVQDLMVGGAPGSTGGTVGAGPAIRRGSFRLRGGKSSKAPKSLDRLAPGEQFVDLFTGSGSVIHEAVQREAAETFLMGELNPRTANVHRTIKTQPEELTEALRYYLEGVESPTTPETQIVLEDLQRRSLNGEFANDNVAQAAVDLVLGNYSYRYEPGGELSIGPPKAKVIQPERLIRSVEQQSELLQKVDLLELPWQDTLAQANKNAIVFADPPYMRTHGYKHGRFNEAATEELSRALQQHVERGGTVLVDEYPPGMEKFGFLKNVRPTGYGGGKELEGGAGALFLRAGDKSSPFFSALARNWQAFRSGKGAAQKAFSPEQLAARFKQMGSVDELKAGGFLEVLERLPKNTKLPAEKVDNWLERNNLAGKVRVHELRELTAQELRTFAAEGPKTPAYPTSHISPFVPFKEGDYREEVLGYTNKTLGVLLEPRLSIESRRAHRLTRVDELMDQLYVAGPKGRVIYEETDVFDLQDFKEAREAIGQPAPTKAHVNRQWNALNELLESQLVRGNRLRNRYTGQKALRAPDSERQKLLDELYQIADVTLLPSSEIPSDSPVRFQYAPKPIEETRLQSATPFESQPYHYDKVDKGAFAWGRLVDDVIDPELGRGTYAVELQSNIAAMNAEANPKRIGPFIERGIGPSIDAMLFGAAKRGDDFVAIPIADREFWKHRYSGAADPENYKWIEALYGEKGAIAQQLKARIKSTSGEKVEAERRMLQFSVRRNARERQHHEAIVVPLSEEAREAILQKGFKISKLEQLTEVARSAFA
jgi:site-specific DNA-adenine methylase